MTPAACVVHRRPERRERDVIVVEHSFAYLRLKCDPQDVYSPYRTWYTRTMGGSIPCERYWSRADYDKDLIARAKFSMEVLNRAPDSEEPDPKEGEMIVMDRLDCWDLLKRAKLALEFFYPHFRIHDEIMSRAREDWDWRFKEFFSRLARWDWKDRNGRALVEQHEKMIAGFDRMLGQVSATDKNQIEIESKVVHAARNWINWHDSEMGRCNFRGAYR